ncbi:MAG: glutamine-hydrolyzing GMP synthase, partial [Myxococcales bacterium]|nr:glutamine-hydrolyzing GMP synthase [Myxococcales bacterium]
MQAGHHQTLIVIDFGSQVTQLIARRVRELGVYAEILPYSASLEQLRARNPRAVILSGGPSSLHEEDAPQLDRRVLELGVPVLGICYGMYALVDALGGAVEPAAEREFGATAVTIDESAGPAAPFPAGSQEPVWMSHGDKVARLPDGFRTVARSESCEHAAVFHPDRKLWAVQFHPEVTHTPRGGEVLAAFLDLAGFARDWTTSSFIEDAIATVRAQVGDAGTVICGLSGGV